ncbi:Pca regulon regulatory protein [Corynebacterium occultum]|uniref:Pca regulon regulatory protein n=1 Tax=Corynebacterium occultum TaxID=2675219 RepID=A0A6B8W827_9CORY|nr:IclR family transcriptional regulator [Corynebacterium occultum]QGU07046.1 Pca regulon regulatory protein [Corynebacterium occultum]
MVQVPAVRNALRILNLLSSVGVPLSASRITAELGIPRSSVYHLLTEMEEAGYVMPLPEEKTYGLGIAAYSLANVYATQQPLVNLGAKYVRNTAEVVAGCGQIARLVGPEVLYLYDYRSPGAPVSSLAAGARLSAARTASGRAIISALPETEARSVYTIGESAGLSWRDFQTECQKIREAGFAEEIDESVRGFRSLSVPVLDHLQRPAVALTVTFLTSRDIGEKEKEMVVTCLQRGATELSQRIFGLGAKQGSSFMGRVLNGAGPLRGKLNP